MEEESPAQQFLALFALAVLAALLYFIWVSAPISLYCLGGLGVGWCWKALNAAAEEEQFGPLTIRERLWRAVSKDLAKMVFAFGVGAALVWIAQIALGLGSFSPEAVGDFQIRVYDFADGLKGWTSLPVAVGAVILAFAMSMSFNTLWPLNALARVRKAAGVTVGILAAVVGFSFVGVRANAAYYQDPANGLRAEAIGKLDELIAARRAQAALQWLGATLIEKQPQSVADEKVSRQYFDQAGEQCETAQNSFDRGYGGRSYDRDPSRNLCLSYRYQASMARSLEHPPRYAGPPAAATAWIHDFGDVTLETPPAKAETGEAIAPERTFQLVPRMRRLSDLHALIGRIDLALNDAKKARKSIEGTVSQLAASRFKGLTAAMPDLVSIWVDPLIGIVADEAVEKVSARLRALRLPLPQAAHRLLYEGIDPVTIDEPADRVREAGSLRAALAQLWRVHLASKGLPTDLLPDSPVFEHAAAEVAKQDTKAAEARREDAHRQNERLKQWRASRSKSGVRRGR